MTERSRRPSGEQQPGEQQPGEYRKPVPRKGESPAILVMACLALSACSGGSLGPETTWLYKTAADIEARVHEGGGEAAGAAAPARRPGTAASVRERTAFVIGGSLEADLLGGLSDEPINVELSFQDAEIREVVTTILGDVLRQEFTLDPLLRGKVSLNTGRGLSPRSLVTILNDAVVQAGGRMSRSGKLFQIVAVQGRESRAVELSRANPAVTFVPLRYTQASNVEALLNTVFPDAKQISVDAERNILIVGGPEPLRQSIVRTAELFDTDVLREKTLAVYPLAHAKAKDVIGQLERLYEQSEADSYRSVQFLPIERLNAILAVTRVPEMLERLEAVIKGLDKGSAGQRRFHVVELQHAKAEVLADLLSKAMGDTAGQALGLPLAPAFPLAAPPAQAAAFRPADPGGAGALEAFPQAPHAPQVVPGDRDVRIIAHIESNALLVFASSAEFAVISHAIQQLDVRPPQVLIEATIMEVTLNDRLSYGVQAFLKSTDPDYTLGFFGGATAALAGAFPGFNFIFQEGDVEAVIDALRAVTDVSVLSQPQIVTVDNEEAVLQVGDEVPITVREVVDATTPDAPTISSIEYRQTGVILSVIPQINKSGDVTLDIRQEVTNAAQVEGSSSLTPILSRRAIETRVSARTGQTIVLGGLVSERKTDTRDRLPVLGDIPVIGEVFGTTDSVLAKTELIVFLTPTVFTDPEEAKAVTIELMNRINSLWSD